MARGCAVLICTPTRALQPCQVGADKQSKPICTHLHKQCRVQSKQCGILQLAYMPAEPRQHAILSFGEALGDAKTVWWLALQHDAWLQVQVIMVHGQG